MKPFLTALMIALGYADLALASNPLTVAEQTVCSSLKHCLDIIETHPHDSYDYAVLANEFERYGTRGRKALLKRLQSDKPFAGHAADLLALTRDPSLLPALHDLAERSQGGTRQLIERTREAVDIRLSVTALPRSRSKTAKSKPPRLPICEIGKSIDATNQKREMPFFEADIARPDRYGAYRPSAKHRLALLRASRGDLNSAVSRIGGWLAGYTGGLIYYDAETGAPTIVSRDPIISIQRINPDQISPSVWAISESEGQLRILNASPPKPRLVASLPGGLAELRRGSDGSLYVSSTNRATIRLKSDGTAASGCTVQS